jgi:glycosyltransferase involved in cell wall biosynthesis
VIVWAGSRTLENLPEKKWLEKCSHPWLNRAMPFRMRWQQQVLPKAARERKIDVLIAPGGIVPFLSVGAPRVAISQNLLPFDQTSRKKYPLTDFMSWKLFLIRLLQKRSFESAEGLIFLSDFANKEISGQLREKPRAVTVIPHGIESRFFHESRREKARNTFRFLYVSTVDRYKHQIEVATAIAQLRNEGLDVAVDFVGAAHAPALKPFLSTIEKLDPDETFLAYLGQRAFDKLHADYGTADAFIFASSCENLPNILLEAMASGLPIACSNRGPMPEVLGDNGFYFDPENVDSIKKAVRDLLTSPAKRHTFRERAQENARRYSWEKCARDTFAFVAEVARKGPMNA